MLNSIVTIICIALIAFILFWFFKKPEKSGQKGPAKKRLPRDSSGCHGGLYA